MNNRETHLRMDQAQGVILVVDDEEDIRCLVNRILSAQGYVIEEACDGQDALWHIASQPMGLIICNICMPRMNGIVLFEQIARLAPALTERFLFCSGDTVSSESTRFLERCGRPYLAKPFDLDIFIGLVRQHYSAPLRMGPLAAEQAYIIAGARPLGVWGWCSQG